MRKKLKIKWIATDKYELKAASRDKIIEVVIPRRRPIRCKWVYVELGCTVNDEAIRHLKKLRRTKEEFIITANDQRISLPGLYAVGDCINSLGQISVATGEAAVAATTIHNDLM